MTPKKRKGFTLIELVVAISLLTIIGAGVYKVRAENAAVQKDNYNRQKAVWIMQNQVEKLRSQSFNELEETRLAPFPEQAGGNNDHPAFNGKMTVEKVAPDLKRIRLRLNWTGIRGNKKEMALTLYRTQP